MRYVDWTEPWHLRSIWTSAWLPQACIGTALGLFVASGTPTSYWWLLGFALLLLAGFRGGVAFPAKPLALGAGTLTALTWAGTAAAYIYSSDYAEISLAIAMWTTVMGVMICLRVTEQALRWALPLIVLHAILTILQGVDFGSHSAHYPRAVGISGTPSTASGLLLIGTSIVAKTRMKYGGILFIAAIPFTGSRLAIGILASLIAVAGVKISWRWGLLAALVLIVTMVAFGPTVEAATRYNAVDGIPAEIVTRITMPFSAPAGVSTIWQGIIPLGYSGDSATHALPLRLWYEVGAVGAVAWALLTWGALTRRFWSPAWWVLLTIAMISSLDYYTWMPLSVSAFWWLAVRLQFQNANAPERRR